MNELEALKNFGERLGLSIKECHNEDKRKTIKLFFAMNSDSIIVSPPLDYEKLNHFLLGWNNCLKFISISNK